jgi:hypothetical protein
MELSTPQCDSCPRLAQSPRPMPCVGRHQGSQVVTHGYPGRRYVTLGQLCVWTVVHIKPFSHLLAARVSLFAS